LRERGGAELLTLERFDVTRSFPSLGSDVERMGHAAYAAELATKLCAPRQAEPGIFDLIVTFLVGLESTGGHEERLRIFEIALLDLLGFAPALDACVVCGRRDLSTTAQVIDVRWVPDQGGVVCRACGTRGRPMRPSVRLALLAYAGTPLDMVAVEAVPPDIARGCRDALAELIAGHLSAPLRSLEFLAKMQVTEKRS
jgi:DNA repair protein RecO